jgi:UDP-N-acetylmuramate dehydrogenase
MQPYAETEARLAQIPDLNISRGAPLSRYTRFGIGGPADLYVESANESSFIAALRTARESGCDYVVIGGGTNLIVSDSGFRGIVLRFTASAIRNIGQVVEAYAGAELQALVEYTVERGLKGLETMTGIPGSVGAAVYGNAGAYGHSIMERVSQVRFFDGERVRVFENEECEFHYRESIFKRRKDWIIFSTELRMDTAPAEELRRTAEQILKVRNEKYPPSMKCAGSIFKNLILAELPGEVRSRIPERVVREGKAPSAWFLEEVGAKGMRNGGIRVADYHANLIYNDGGGSARELREVIDELKTRVHARFGIVLEEEVQYVGFNGAGAGRAAGENQPD